ncbi:hypothetical protein BKA70DRAFT_1226204 [Coprinopsis sp. MPI-PUGE-AT-0042]|nr:hypothetical protein BKA70DRAFT_1226204 [Coprinopsis sp. MPI-PUGE-AT-0042]
MAPGDLDLDLGVASAPSERYRHNYFDEDQREAKSFSRGAACVADGGGAGICPSKHTPSLCRWLVNSPTDESNRVKESYRTDPLAGTAKLRSQFEGLYISACRVDEARPVVKGNATQDENGFQFVSLGLARSFQGPLVRGLDSNEGWYRGWLIDGWILRARKTGPANEEHPSITIIAYPLRHNGKVHLL